MLTLPPADSALLNLDAFDTEAYERVLNALWEATGEDMWLGGQHWVGGHVPDAEGLSHEPGHVLLLHLAEDDALEFSFLDAGTIQFKIPADALARGDYGAVEADPSSC
jgi:hypothetical protein